ncbi:CHAP domain-containing protein [Gluconacetobacter tumulicola]|uniref:CHAP domain-containing protein n=1 Tax=Gluconacetobacter tumulicola TaxID=1017177 RepID=A0A7W4JGM0_9PROT|nr:CHAP domain-containing protein [Gluconacetobacter tumulicola]MBB2180910.1 CHAP domain-containing protein [Gluconacetobacter tumulicola]
MRAGGLGRAFLFSVAAASLGLVFSSNADARQSVHRATHITHANHTAYTAHHGRHVAFRTGRHHEAGRVIQCVAFAKSASDVMLRGNAANWWYNAAGVYARGAAPEAGSILNFRANRRMPLGHVAVVRQIVDSRTIVIDQSHWAQRGISRNVAVIDVSPNNDWTAVRVALNQNGAYGSIYPTYGFIYSRPDSSGRIMTASSERSIPQPLNSAPSDLRHPMRTTEVAEAPESLPSVTYGHAFREDAPNRSIR